MYRESRARTRQLFAPRMGGRVGHLVDWFIMLLIAANVLVVMAETVDSVYETFGTFFYWFEIASVVIFTVEYLGRVWTCVEDPQYEGPISGRVRYASRPLLVVDLIAILPFYLGAMMTVDLRVLRAFRLIRFFRLFKLARYSESMVAFAAVAREKREELVISFFATAILWIVASSLMYHLERAAQPETFSSIPHALWWGVITLTTVGYGDVVPVTPLGKVFGAIVAVLGIGLFALPASIFASGFVEHTIGARTCPHCGAGIDEKP